MEISDTLPNSLDVRVEPFAVCDVRDGSYLDKPANGICTIHYVLFGNGTLSTRRGNEISLQQDQVVLIPTGVPQRIESGSRLAAHEDPGSICLQPSESIPESQFIFPRFQITL